MSQKSKQKKLNKNLIATAIKSFLKITGLSNTFEKLTSKVNKQLSPAN